MNRLILIVLLSFFSTHTVYAGAVKSEASQEDKIVFEKIFTDWTKAFNNKDVANTCAIFSPAVVAYYQGLPPKQFSVLCDGFKTIFKETNKTYKYQFKVHEVYRSGDLAAVRVTWFLDIKETGKPPSAAKDEGLDIFERDSSGNWKIINYLAYPVIQTFNEVM